MIKSSGTYLHYKYTTAPESSQAVRKNIKYIISDTFFDNVKIISIFL
jgi:hypothetical protein